MCGGTLEILVAIWWIAQILAIYTSRSVLNVRMTGFFVVVLLKKNHYASVSQAN